MSHPTLPVSTVPNVVDFVLAFLLGGLFEVTGRFVGQLMPQTLQTVSAEWIGLAIGVALSAAFVSSKINHQRTNRTNGTVLFAAAISSLLMAGFGALVRSHLWLNATFTGVATLLFARTLFLVVSMAPIGVAVGTICSRCLFRNNLRIAVSFVAGLVLSKSASDQVETGTMIALFGCLIGVIGCVESFSLFVPRRNSTAASFRSRCQFACRLVLSLAAISSFCWVNGEQVAKESKLLFSTQSLIAYQSQWDAKLLPVIDDQRLIATSQGSHGTLTLWKSNG
ncbi:MAG: hypothetical protein FJ267_20225, partial [Planctomycetes bacterium]|nr:hypothetical protein [Planctomycetota bacterium]